jgi:DNA invertase Pin-like site-specific DNA recombinase
VSIRATDMPGADDLMMRIYAAMAQKERELISARTKAALAAAKAGGRCWGAIGVIGPCEHRTRLLPPLREGWHPGGRPTGWRGR